MMKKHHKLKNLYFFMAERREFSYTAAVAAVSSQNDSRLSGKIMQIVNEAIFETAWCGDCCFLK